MIVGLLQLELFMPASNSLKAKRAVLSSLKKRLRNKFNVSVAEVENLDKWQRASLGMATVSNERRLIDSTMNEILKVVDIESELEVIDYSIEVI